MQMIEFIKDEFSKPSILIYKYKGCLLESLKSNDFNKAYDITLTQNVNECSELTFSIMVTEDRKLDYSSNELLVYFTNIWFIIKDIETDLTNHTMKFTCTEMSCVLKGIYCEELNIIGETASSIFSKIVTSTGYTDIGFQWLGTDVDNSILRHLIADSETSVYENLVNMAKNFNGSIEFSYDVSGVGYVYLKTQSTTSHKFIRKEIDIKSLSITSSSSEIYTRLYPTGFTDENGIVLDVQSVNGGKAILEDFSYFKSLGIPDDVIANNPQYQQIKTLSDDTYTDANDLLTYAKEELAKYCKPQFSAECSILDLSCYIDSVIEQPKINMGLKIIDKSINFIFDCLITGIERNYNNPSETKLMISNVIPYSTSFQSLQASSGVVSKVISTTNGVPYIPVSSVRDSASGTSFVDLLAEKVNITDFSSLIKQYPTSVLEAVNNVANATDVNLSANNGLVVNKGKAQIFNLNNKKVFWVNESGQVSIADNMQIYSNGVLVADIGYLNGVLNVENKNGDINLIGTNIKINGQNLNDLINQLITNHV